MAELRPEALEALARLDDQAWDGITTRLLKFASYRTKRLTWYGKTGGAMPNATQIQDLVQEAIMDTLSGERAWNPNTDPDLENFLRSTLNSKINHFVNSLDHKVFTDSALSSAPGEAVENGGDAPKATFLGNQPTPEVAVSESLDADAFLTGLLEYLADDAEAQQVVECIMDGVTKPKDCAERMGKSDKAMYNITKRFRRKRDEFLKLWRKQEGG